MAIPDFQTLMLPLRRTSTDGEIRPIGRVVDSLAREFQLTDEDLRQLRPSGRQTTFRHRVAWARTYLSKAGLLSSPKRAHFRITPAGQPHSPPNPPESISVFSTRFRSSENFAPPNTKKPRRRL